MNKRRLAAAAAVIILAFSFSSLIQSEDDFINIDMSIAPKDTSAASEPAVSQDTGTAVNTPEVQDTPIPPPPQEQVKAQESEAAVQPSIEEEDTEGIIIISPGETEVNRLEEFMVKRRRPVSQDLQVRKGTVESVEEEVSRQQAAAREKTGTEAPGYADEGDYEITFDYGGDESAVVVVEAQEKAVIERAGYVLVEKAGFISKNFTEDGFIYNLNKRVMMAQTDTAFIRLTAGVPVKAGTEFMIYSDKEEVFDADGGEPLGNLIKVAGVAKVLEKAKDNTYKVRITRSYEPINIDYKIKARRDVRDYHVKLTSKVRGKGRVSEVSGSIVKVHGDAVTPSVRHIVYINRGVGDGILPGDRFNVYQKGRDEEAGEDTSYDIKGQLLIINAMHNSATALILKHDRLVKAGDAVKLVRN